MSEPYLLARGDALRIPLPDQSVDLVCGSPPYMDARTYGIGAQRDCREWVDWMLAVTAEALRVSRGAVIWVVGGVTRDRTYWPGCEGLLWEWWSRGGSCYRPVYWHRSGIPGNGGDDWFRSDVEYCLCFKRPGRLPWAENTACGEPPKCRPGGMPSHRLRDGQRANRKRGVGGRRSGSGQSRYYEPWAELRGYSEPDIANPGNLIDTGAAGGGTYGGAYAHESEAPYPVAVPEFFIRSLCPPGGIVLDPFLGSGSTAEAAIKNGRRAIGLDIRQCKGALLTAKRRLERPHAPVPRQKPDERFPLFDGHAAV